MKNTRSALFAIVLLTSGLSQADLITDLTDRANKGEVVAQLELADIYARGEGVAKDQGAATQWILKAAEQGDVGAQIMMGHRYVKGGGITKSPEEALRWFSKAAQSGSAEAQIALGGVYLSGKGVKRDSSEAAKWFTMAATEGNPSAQCQLARMHMTGAGVPKDNLEAYKWASLAAKQGDREAAVVVDFLKRKMTPAQLTKFRKQLRDAAENKTLDLSPLLPSETPDSLPTELPVGPE